MSDPKYNFQFCQKLIVFSKDWKKVLVAKRHGERDYDGMFSFIGGKMEVGDESIAAGLRREKDEEIGPEVVIKVYLDATYNFLYRKQDGDTMILPHYLAQYAGGEIRLNTEEYSEYRWVAVGDLAKLEPKIENIPRCVAWAQTLQQSIQNQNLTIV